METLALLGGRGQVTDSWCADKGLNLGGARGAIECPKASEFPTLNLPQSTSPIIRSNDLATCCPGTAFRDCGAIPASSIRGKANYCCPQSHLRSPVTLRNRRSR